MVILQVGRLLLAAVLAFGVGKLVARLGLPSILGWLITGMALGPHALGLLQSDVLDSDWFSAAESILECTVGLMIGTELLWGKLKKAGKQIVVTTITESLGTFAVVSLVFGAIFWAVGVPVYLAFLFGGIALATAPAPSLSIVNQMKTSGPVTSTLIPMAALDDLVGALVFFTVVAFVSAHISTAGVPVGVVLFLVFLPVLIGLATGFAAGRLMRKMRTQRTALAVMLAMLLASAGIGFAINRALPSPVLNFMLIGMGYSTMFANMISAEQLAGIMKVMDPVIGLGLIVVILNLGAPLDYHLIFGAGLYTAIYIAARAVGKYTGAYFGAAVTHAPKTGEEVFGLYAAAPFRCFAGVYRHRRVGAERPGAGVCLYHSEHHCGGSCD